MTPLVMSAPTLLLLLGQQHLLALAFSEGSTEVGQCHFQNDPVGVGYFWDPSCRMGMLGCNADGQNIECRLCGAGDFSTVLCPPSSCKFPNEPFVAYYWEADCTMGMLGCWADGVHAQCRFCGDFPFTSISCPEGAAKPKGAACIFDNEPGTPYYWEPGCEMGKHGCNADGVNVHCRFCGEGVFSDVPCSASQVCQFAQPPTVPYFWDQSCKEGMLGCKADGIHPECRFCAKRPFEEVPCPGPVAPPQEVGCTWPLHGEPVLPFFWDPTCKMGKLGCWADGIHGECCFCGEGVYSAIECPEGATRTQAGGKLERQEQNGSQFVWLSAPAAAYREQLSGEARRINKTAEDDEDEWWLAHAPQTQSSIVAFATAALAVVFRT